MSKCAISEQEIYDNEEFSIYETIGKNAKRIMRSSANLKGRRITNEEIAKEFRKRTGKPDAYVTSTITRKLNGDGHFKISELLMLSDILGYSLNYLCSDEKKPRSNPRDHEAAERYTGLSPEAVRYLHKLNKKKLAILSTILSRDSGLDSILQDICDSKKTVRDAAMIETRLRLAIAQHNSASKDHYETKISYSQNSTKTEKIFVPADDKNNLYHREEDICDQLDLLQLQEFRQENYKRNIRMAFERLLNSLVPSVKSKYIPNPEETKRKFKQLMSQHIV